MFLKYKTKYLSNIKKERINASAYDDNYFGSTYYYFLYQLENKWA